ncbi:hypothetical protein G4Q83_04610 [Xanthomonas theicola]|nr:hypothetical protein [Xanthomonas theicola]QNH23478.1 hypothetical protein G4Q83_04610 [Xanthomonas theicola]
MHPRAARGWAQVAAATMTISLQLSRHAQALSGSAIREILKVTERPEVISFAGGFTSDFTDTDKKGN